MILPIGISSCTNCGEEPITCNICNKILNYLKILIEERNLFSGKYQFLRFLADDSYLTNDILLNKEKIANYVKYYVKKYSNMPLILLKDEYASLRKVLNENKSVDEKNGKITRILQDVPIILATAFIVGGSINLDTITRFLIVSAIFVPFLLLYLVFSGSLNMRLVRPVLQEQNLTNLIAVLTMAFIIDETK
ncbi:MAG: hypothetical protein HeimC3_30540 [Candidatus Heimdallarchaeota archaeon LC_3]|nr:MAG: hypothetical protein HeimC3_30540 [Candidatus Heimdallarchaeota archaeon LC_3]